MRFFAVPAMATLGMVATIATTSQAQAAPTPPNLSNAQFQQCLTGLKNSSTFKGVTDSTFERYRPS